MRNEFHRTHHSLAHATHLSPFYLPAVNPTNPHAASPFSPVITLTWTWRAWDEWMSVTRPGNVWKMSVRCWGTGGKKGKKENSKKENNKSNKRKKRQWMLKGKNEEWVTNGEREIKKMEKARNRKKGKWKEENGVRKKRICEWTTSGSVAFTTCSMSVHHTTREQHEKWASNAEAKGKKLKGKKWVVKGKKQKRMSVKKKHKKETIAKINMGERMEEKRK